MLMESDAREMALVVRSAAIAPCTVCRCPQSERNPADDPGCRRPTPIASGSRLQTGDPIAPQPGVQARPICSQSSQ